MDTVQIEIMFTAGLGLALAGVAGILGHMHGIDAAKRATDAELDAAYDDGYRDGQEDERVATGPRPASIEAPPSNVVPITTGLNMTRLDVMRPIREFQ